MESPQRRGRRHPQGMPRRRGGMGRAGTPTSESARAVRSLSPRSTRAFARRVRAGDFKTASGV
eukprot:10260805-Lingulodinium_polyedra.AAC.1